MARPALRRQILLPFVWLLATLPSATLADASRWEKAIAAFESWDAKNTPARDPVLFVGSSSIRMWPTRAHFPDLPVVNRGFGGAHTSDVNAFAERIVAPYEPRVVVFYCGDNDIKAGKSRKRVVADIRAFVSFVHKTTPNARIIYLPIKPSISRWDWWKPMDEVNQVILADSEADAKLYYADVATPMLPPDDSMPAADLFIEDGLHLSEKGYAVWVKALRPVLDAALAAR